MVGPSKLYCNVVRLNAIRNVNNAGDEEYKITIYIITIIYVTGFRKTDHIVTIDIARNTDLKY